MKEADLIEKLKDYLEKGETLTFEIYEVMDIISGNFEAYRIECKDIEILGDTDSCLIRIFIGGKEKHRINNLARYRDYGDAMANTYRFFERIIIRLGKSFKEEGKELEIVETDKKG